VVDPSETTRTETTVVETLVAVSQRSDFGVFVFGTDDRIVTDKGESQWAPRDNVIYELGIFTGALGIDHTFVVAAEGVRILTDLEGVIRHPFDSDGANDLRRLRAAVSSQCLEIVTKMTEVLAREPQPEGGVPSASMTGGDVLAIQVYADLQAGLLAPLPAGDAARGRSVVHGEFGVGRVITLGPDGHSGSVVVRFSSGLLTVPLAELRLATRA
jgi:hypothetical protein